MGINTILLGVLLVLAIAACAVGIWAIFEGAKTARSVRTLSDDLDAHVVPLLEKADVTIDALNAELLRIDSIVSRIEEVTERVESTTRTVQDVANAPGEIVNDIADRVRRAWKNRKSEPSAAGDARHAHAEATAEADSAARSEEASAAPEPPVWPALVPDAPDSPTNPDGPEAEDAPYL